MTSPPTAPIRAEPPEIGDRVRAAEAVVAAALAAFQAQEWEVVTALTDADSIEKLRRSYLDGRARQSAPRPPQSWRPTDPDQVDLDYLEGLIADMPITFHELAGVSTLEEAEALSAEEFMVRWAQARHDGYLAAHGGHAAGMTVQRAVLGSVAMLPDTVVVLVRAVNVGFSQPLAPLGMVAVLGDGCGEWRLDAQYSWLGLADCIIR